MLQFLATFEILLENIIKAFLAIFGVNLHFHLNKNKIKK